jgi:hypothetical protein
LAAAMIVMALILQRVLSDAKLFVPAKAGN